METSIPYPTKTTIFLVHSIILTYRDTNFKNTYGFHVENYLPPQKIKLFS